MKRVFACVCLLALVSLVGCWAFFHGGDLIVEPDSGHPPFEVTVTAPQISGTYTWHFEDHDLQTTRNVMRMLVEEWPAVVAVTLPTGDLQTASVNLMNEAPVILRPTITSRSVCDWGTYLIPGQRYLVDWNPQRDRYSEKRGVWDPEGDDWWIVSMEIQCAEKTMPDTLFCPPYQGVWHARQWFNQGDVIENAVAWYPVWTGKMEPLTGMPYAPFPESGYPCDACNNRNKTPGRFPSQVAAIKVEVEDEYGARATAEFEVNLSPAGCSR